MAASDTKNPLVERDPNTSSPTKKLASPFKHKPVAEKNSPDTDTITMQGDAQVFEKSTTQEIAKKVSEAHAMGQIYVSPSDEIMSPTTKKLGEIRGKRFANAKPHSLFAKTVAREGMRSQEKLNSMTRTTEQR